jgi:hypothetical protein
LLLRGGIDCNFREQQGQILTDEQEALSPLLLGIDRKYARALHRKKNV